MTTTPQTHRELIHAKVVRTRAAQGLPPTVQDPAALERVAALFELMTPTEPRR
jgi:hypothetical protein